MHITSWNVQPTCTIALSHIHTLYKGMEWAHPTCPITLSQIQTYYKRRDPASEMAVFYT